MIPKALSLSVKMNARNELQFLKYESFISYEQRLMTHPGVLQHQYHERLLISNMAPHKILATASCHATKVVKVSETECLSGSAL